MDIDTRSRFLLPAKSEYDYLFAENGLNAFKAGELLAVQSLKTALGEDNLKVRTTCVLLCTVTFGCILG